MHDERIHALFLWSIPTVKMFFIPNLFFNEPRGKPTNQWHRKAYPFLFVTSTQLQKLIRNWPTKQREMTFSTFNFIKSTSLTSNLLLSTRRKFAINFCHRWLSSIPEIQIVSPWSFHFYDTVQKDDDGCGDDPFRKSNVFSPV